MSDEKKDVDVTQPTEATTDEKITTLNNPMPAPPAGPNATTRKNNPMPSEPADNAVKTMNNPMPAPPALDLDNK
ncbi:hypothetical protein [Streptomyces acidicola]|uniref:hypothetical protein n=1 Tax=Streptomyces acidicola TaxID=2596892 RepID=UPI00341BADB6